MRRSQLFSDNAGYQKDQNNRKSEIDQSKLGYDQ